MNREQPSWRERLVPQAAIAAILGFVAVYDYFAKDELLISSEVDRLRENPMTGPMTHFVLDGLYNHLKRSVEPDNDPIHQLGKLLRPKSPKPKLTGEFRFDVFGTD